jgi:hypothetical protein
MQAAQSTTTTALGHIGASFQQLPPLASSAGSAGGQGFTQGLAGALAAAVGIAASVVGQIAGALSIDLSGPGQSLGASFGQGVVSGISGYISAAASAAAALAQAVMAGANSVLQAHSPSKAAIELFSTVPQGAVVALAQGINDVRRAAAGLGTAALPNLASMSVSPALSLAGTSIAPTRGGDTFVDNRQFFALKADDYAEVIEGAKRGHAAMGLFEGAPKAQQLVKGRR